MAISRFKSAKHFFVVAAVVAVTVVGYQASVVAAEKPAGGKSAAHAGALKVSVSLSPEMAKKAKPDDVVFIFARAAQGPRMPLAVARKLVKELPLTVTLDDSLSMTPEMKMSNVSEVIVVARVSKSGLATAQAGDLEGVSEPVKAGTKAISINIAKEVAVP